MATASAVTQTYSNPGVEQTENYADALNSQFEFVKRRVWSQPIQGLKYWQVRSSSKADIKLSYLTSAGLMHENADTDEMPFTDVKQGFDTTITPKVYRMGIRIEQRLRETDQFSVIDRQMADLNMSAKETIEQYAALPFNTAFATTVAWVCADGMNLVDSARPSAVKSVANWSNLESASALTQSSVATMRLNFRKNDNERGHRRPLKLDKLVIPADLEDTAITELQSVLKPGSSLNDKNFLTQYGVNYEVWEYLTSTTAWFGMAPKDDLYELFWYWGAMPQISNLTFDSNPDVWGKRIRFVYNSGCSRPHSLRGNSGS